MSNAEYRTCRKCGASLPATTEFFYGRGGGLRADCIPCFRAANKDRTDPEKNRARAREWRLANPEKARARLRDPEYIAKNRARATAWAKANPDKVAERSRTRRATDPAYREYARQARSLRRAREAGARIGRIHWKALAERYGRTCHLCRLPIPEGDLEWDHIVPLARGGSHTDDNLAPAHMRCNRAKSTMTVEDFALRQFEELLAV